MHLRSTKFFSPESYSSRWRVFFYSLGVRFFVQPPSYYPSPIALYLFPAIRLVIGTLRMNRSRLCFITLALALLALVLWRNAERPERADRDGTYNSSLHIVPPPKNLLLLH
jgi:hypothetical protein